MFSTSWLLSMWWRKVRISADGQVDYSSLSCFRRTVLPAVNPCYLPVCHEVGRDSTVIVAIVTSFLSGLSLTPWTSMSASSGWDHPVIMMNR
jgi:hypothetical protein